ncbi:uncharacterized protein LOC141630987 [Silene latifolia]|uniref:uncharacterized protein LOC141630987 n=1 Tax=Silene latifolia TaxID=37657 RepID=UPI003D772E76
MKPNGVTDEQLQLRAFPFSLKDAANDWLYYLPTGSITTWNQMKKDFLEKYFPASLSSQLKKEISNVEQMDGENLYEYWERFKQLLASCPYHGYTDHDLLLNFFGGLLKDDARMIKASTQGGIEYMSVQEANELIERLVGSSRNFGRRIRKTSGTSSSRQSSNHMEEKVDFLTNLVKELTKGSGNASYVKFCGLCNDPTHPTDGCPSLQTEEAIEAVKAIGFRKFDPYSNTYNEGWKSHPNMGASINVLPNYLYESLKLGPLKPTRTVISLADRSNIYPKGIVEDVLVKVGEMLFPADFFLIEMEPEKGATPILLGRPFMRTSNTKIDVSSGHLTMEF